MKSFGLFLLLGLISAAVQANDWPQFLGPNRNGICQESNLAEKWPAEGPPVVWRRSVGQGFCGPAVAAGRLILFHRVDDKEVVECLDASTGKSIWTNSYPTAYRDDFGFDEGPRATPAIADGRVYTYGAEGTLTCVDLARGTNVWRVNARTDFQVSKGFFGLACSPLIEGNAVVVDIGGKEDTAIVAFDKLSGKILWKTARDEASYSSPVAGTIHNRRYGFILTRSFLNGIDLTSGKVLFQFPFRPPIRSSVTAATPVVVDDLIFISASYGTGCALLKIGDNKPEKLWGDDETMSNHYATCIHHNGFLFGIHGRTDPGFGSGASLRCVDLKSGKVRWEKDGFGAATMTLAGDQLLCLSERGELIQAPASPEGFKPICRAQILGSQTRAHPALADGLFFARSKDTLVCVDLRKGK